MSDLATKVEESAWSELFERYVDDKNSGEIENWSHSEHLAITNAVLDLALLFGVSDRSIWYIIDAGIE